MVQTESQSRRNQDRSEEYLMRTGPLRCTIIAVTGAVVVAVSPLAAEPVALRGYNAAIGESSVSGISSGAFMAVQFGTAWSSVIKGVGVIAGGPYWCAKADADDFINGFTLPIMTATGSCMTGPPPDLNIFIAKADAKAASGDIDPLPNLRRQKVYLFHGTNDAVVAKSVTDAAADFYRHYLGDGSRGNLYYQSAVGAGHSLVVRQQPDINGLNNCPDNQGPFIDQCGYDQAGIVLQHIYGALSPPNRGQLAGTMQRFDQSAYSGPDDPGALSLGDTGFVFVPKDCADGAACRVHIALHGCKQDVGDIDRKFIDDTGYNSWADTNHLIVLYPQTSSSSFAPFNPQACWDWWSYVNHEDSYVTKSGAQIKAIKAMLDALTAKAAPVVTPAAASVDTAPTALAIVDTSDTSADLVWKAVGGATAYRISRAEADGPFAVISDTTGPSFGDSGLKPHAAYRWRVAAVINNVEGPVSIEATASTRSTPAPCDTPGTCPIAR
jgi:poly(3-hydroxybutyrate) depolymerase